MSVELTVALVSGPLREGEKAANLATMEQIIDRDGDERAHLYVFSEANVNGGFWEDGSTAYAALAEAVPGGESVKRIAALAQSRRVGICAGLIEVERSRYYITHFLCGPDGYVGKQRKLFATNARHQSIFSNGDSFAVHQLLGYRIAVLACADFLFPEPTILAGMGDPSLLIAPTDCFAADQQELVQRLLAARAIDVGCHAVAAFGHSAAENGAVLAGMAVGPRGDLIKSHTRNAGELALCRLRLPLRAPDRRWGNPTARALTLVRHIQTAIPDEALSEV